MRSACLLTKALPARLFRFEHAPIKSALAPVTHPVAGASPASMQLTAAETGQAIEYRKAPFLILIKALVQRIRGVGQFLQGRTGVRQGCCALTQPLDRVVARGSVADGADAAHPRLGQIARRLLEGRPVLRLLRRQPQPPLDRPQPPLPERPPTHDLKLPTLHHP